MWEGYLGGGVPVVVVAGSELPIGVVSPAPHGHVWLGYPTGVPYAGSY